MIEGQVVEVFGVFSVTIMVASYALERRATLFIATFAIGCVLAAVYALFLQSYPFLIAESIWAVVAFCRWRTSIKIS